MCVCVCVCVTTYFDEEEGDAVCPQRPSQFHVFHFRFDLRHFPTVIVLLRVGFERVFSILTVGAQLWNEQSVKHFLKKTVTTPGILSSRLLFVLCILWVETPSGWKRNEKKKHKKLKVIQKNMTSSFLLQPAKQINLTHSRCRIYDTKTIVFMTGGIL